MMNRGFSLIEILLVITILAMIAGVGLINFRPGQELSRADEAEVIFNLETYRQAITQMLQTNNGNFPPEIDGTDEDAPANDTYVEIANGIGYFDICDLLVPNYLTELPVAPNTGSYTNCSVYSTGYQMQYTETPIPSVTIRETNTGVVSAPVYGR